MNVLVIPGHGQLGIGGYRVVVDPMLRDGYAIMHLPRMVVFALSTAQRMIRREHRRRARVAGRRVAVAVPVPSFAEALDASLANATERRAWR